MLVSDLKRRVRDSAGDTAVLQFTDTTLNDWINDGIRECVIENSLLQTKASSVTVADQADYALPSDIFKLHSVYVNSLKLTMLTLEEWEERNSGEAGIDPGTGDPIMFYVYAGVLTLYPTPSSELTLQINYTSMPTSLAYDAPNGTVWADLDLNESLPEAFHSRIVTYCLAQVALQDDDFAKYQSLMLEFQTGTKDLKRLKDQADDLYPFISVSSRDMGEVPGMQDLF